MTNWIIDEDFGYEESELRRTLETEDYLFEEEKIGDSKEPDYTVMRAFDQEQNLLSATTYRADGDNLENASEELELGEFEYEEPVRLLNRINRDNYGQDSENKTVADGGVDPLF